MSDAKNCRTCKHLEWVDGEAIDGSDSGFTCNKRQASTVGAEDTAILRQLEDEKYLNRYKRCFEMKGQP